MQISGPSQSGKSIWAQNLLIHQKHLLEVPTQNVIWYSPHGHLPKNTPSYVLGRIGLPWEYEDDVETEKHKIIVIDDFADKTKNSKEMTALFTRHSHHTNTSIIQLTQNVFWSGTDARTRSLNVHYFVLMRQSRDQKQIRLLANQIGQTRKEAEGILEAYNAATKQKSYSYLLVSVHPRDSPELLLRTDIFSPIDADYASVFLLTKPSIKYK